MESLERPSKIRKIDMDAQIGSDLSGTDIPSVDDTTSLPEDGLISVTKNVPDTASARAEVDAKDEPPMSKNAMKRMLRRQRWEDDKDSRKQRRKDKQVARREQKKLDREAAKESQVASEIQATGPRPRRPMPISIPLTILIDCDFDEQMTESETVSMSSQITHCYSKNRKALFRPQLAICSFGGRLRTRFETALKGLHNRWANVHLEDGDFVEVAEKAKTWMVETSQEGLNACSALTSSKMVTPEEGEVIYLTADSDETLEELRPYHTYIIGGIVDRNRHKGICYKRAKDRGVRTAKLPIGEFLQLNSRAVLTTNHVYEIMLRWLELRDWGEAFLRVIPKRKGGTLKDSNTSDEVGRRTLALNSEKVGFDDLVTATEEQEDEEL